MLISSTIARKLLLAYRTHGRHRSTLLISLIRKKQFQMVTSIAMSKDELPLSELKTDWSLEFGILWNSLEARRVSDLKTKHSFHALWCHVSSEIFQGASGVEMFVLWNQFPHMRNLRTMPRGHIVVAVATTSALKTWRSNVLCYLATRSVISLPKVIYRSTRFSLVYSVKYTTCK